MTIKNFIKILTPPIIWNALKYIIRKRRENTFPACSLPYPKHMNALIIANGPSFNEHYPIISKKYREFDIITVNYSLEQEKIRSFSPVFHILIDPNFFNNESDIARTQAMLEKVSWKMTIIVPDIFYEKSISLYSKNSNISIKYMPSRAASEISDQQAAFQLCDRGLASAGCMNVSVMAIFLAIILGYQKIYITGLDMTLNNFSCDETCIVYNDQNHFYDDEKNKKHYLNLMRIYFCLYTAYKQYYFISDYAKYKNIKIINLSLASLLDAFPKGTLQGEIYPFLRP